MDAGKLEDLLKIGLTEGEAKIYVALLELGPSSVGPVRKRTKISHSNIYEILERLIKKGIVTIIIKNNVRTFRAVSPSNLAKYLDMKEEELVRQRRILEQAMPRIEALQSTHPKQEAMMFVGKKGLRTAYKELFKDWEPGDENLWIYVHDKKYSKTADRFYLSYWFEIAKNVRSRGIANPPYRDSPFIKKWKKKHEIRFVDFPIFSHGEVFKDRFLLISWEDPIIAVLVHAKHVSDHFRKYFESLWKIAVK
ncbi:MAG: helix-turn-helix domain-containing protein [Candidatus Aenigmarchaeota archaeon]